MKLHEKVKFYREARGLSQDFLASELGLNQSQYSRRENGNIKFTVQEVSALGRVLDVEPGELMSEATVIFNNSDQKGGNFGQYIAFPEELIRQYEARLKEKITMIENRKGKQ